MARKATSAAIFMGLIGCASIPTNQAIDLGAIVADPDRHDEQRIVVAACINVIIHGVALLPCGQRLPNVDIVESPSGSPGFTNLVSYAHDHMGDAPEQLPVLVLGQFRSAGIDGEKRHSIMVERFRPRR